MRCASADVMLSATPGGQRQRYWVINLLMLTFTHYYLHLEQWKQSVGRFL